MTKTSANVSPENAAVEPCGPLELVCAIANAAGLRAAVDNGADWIGLDYLDDARNVAGLKFENGGIRKAIRYAHDRRCKVIFALACSSGRDWRRWREAIDRAVLFGVDALSLSDPALILYAATHYPGIPLHCTVEHAHLNREAINFYRLQFGITRLLLPRTLSLPALERLTSNTEMEFALLGFSTLSVVSPQHVVHTAPRRDTRAACFKSNPGTVMTTEAGSGAVEFDRCATEIPSANDHSYNTNEPFDLNALRLLPRLRAAGVRAIVVESRCHAPVHLAQATRVWREAIDDCLENVEHYCARRSWLTALYKSAKNMSCAEYRHASV